MTALTRTQNILKQRAATQTHEPAKSASPKHLRVTPNLWLGVSIVAFFFVIALFAPFIAPHAPDQVMAGARLSAPSLEFPFGTDALGRDVFSRVVWGTRIAIWTMLLGVAIATVAGTLPGLIAGYVGGAVDQIMSRVMDLGLAFPGLLLALILVARLGPSLENAIVAMGIISAPGFYRLARSQTISTRRLLYIEAACSIGATDGQILFRHIAPNLLSLFIVIATTRAGILLLASSGLSFVGLGAQPPLPEWGALLIAGRSYLDAAPWLSIFPGACLTLMVVGVNLLGDGLRDALLKK
jgi:ABC-type dipeptide/oligopeptide/nickel transport system permease subunit